MLDIFIFWRYVVSDNEKWSFELRNHLNFKRKMKFL
jgi:hypothetical protein